MVEMDLIYSRFVHNYTWGNAFDKKPIVIYQCLSTSSSVVTMQQLMSPWISTVTVNRGCISVLQKYKALPLEIFMLPMNCSMPKVTQKSGMSNPSFTFTVAIQ